MAARTYPKTTGTADLQLVYGVNADRDKTLKDLGYTYQTAKDWAPAFVGYCESRGWTQAEVLSLYEMETAFNDWVIATNFYMGGGIYYPPNNIFQSRGWVIVPDGWYRCRYGCMTALGHYSGKHSNTYSDRSGSNPGCSPGTCIEIDHNGWLSKYQPDRIGLFSSAWNSDFGVVGGAAYQEGLIIDNFRVVGGMSGKLKDPSFKGYGIAVSNPGECSVVRNCMLTDNNDSGLAIISGTPGYIDACSFFFNKSEGLLCLGNNGLANTIILVASGDEQPCLIRFKALPNSVCGGTYSIVGLKSESRDVLQRPIIVEGPIGNLNLVINGMTCDHRTLQCPELIAINGTGPWQVEVHGLQYGNNVQSLLYDQQSGKRLTGGQPFRGNTFGLNSDEGIYLKSRSSMVFTGTSPTAPLIDFFTATPPSLTAAGSATLAWGTTNATSVIITGVTGAQPVDGSATVQVSTTTIFTLTATGPGGTTQGSVTVSVGSSGGVIPTAFAESPGHTPAMAMDGSSGTFWQSNTSMVSGQWFQVDRGASSPLSSVVFSVPYSNYPWWPPTYDIQSSTNGTTWTNVVTGKVGSAANTATFPTFSTRYVRIVCRGSNPNWWAINNLTLS